MRKVVTADRVFPVSEHARLTVGGDGLQRREMRKKEEEKDRLQQQQRTKRSKEQQKGEREKATAQKRSVATAWQRQTLARLQAQVALKSWSTDHPDPLLRAAVSRAERRRLIKAEMTRLAQETEQKYRPRRRRRVWSRTLWLQAVQRVWVLCRVGRGPGAMGSASTGRRLGPLWQEDLEALAVTEHKTHVRVAVVGHGLKLSSKGPTTNAKKHGNFTLQSSLSTVSKITYTDRSQLSSPLTS
ncbi:hypothetical protein L249_0756 [Ophiocordyceps polyrhachis-furcata BCC 54312]|uniref:Uncharacterized protein n=1 Tax=Ophiocordyceps polyrhachis-furcata BCC 54312 TaxID=1330021 RepID=A0A367LFK7_9HYPO|nr:hypothetical protein L249_0756 [Ophiocordyceps polyrhachis-furcata BCC 54312]